jgi:hypothetical protein
LSIAMLLGGEAPRSAASPERARRRLAISAGWIKQLRGAVRGPGAQNPRRLADNNDPQRERCCIAEIDGNNVGCTLLVKDSERVARAGSSRW